MRGQLFRHVFKRFFENTFKMLDRSRDTFFQAEFWFSFARVFINDVSGCMLESFHSWLE